MAWRCSLPHCIRPSSGYRRQCTGGSATELFSLRSATERVDLNLSSYHWIPGLWKGACGDWSEHFLDDLDDLDDRWIHFRSSKVAFNWRILFAKFAYSSGTLRWASPLAELHPKFDFSSLRFSSFEWNIQLKDSLFEPNKRRYRLSTNTSRRRTTVMMNLQIAFEFRWIRLNFHTLKDAKFTWRKSETLREELGIWPEPLRGGRTGARSNWAFRRGKQSKSLRTRMPNTHTENTKHYELERRRAANSKTNRIALAACVAKRPAGSSTVRSISEINYLNYLKSQWIKNSLQKIASHFILSLEKFSFLALCESYICHYERI